MQALSASLQMHCTLQVRPLICTMAYSLLQVSPISSPVITAPSACLPFTWKASRFGSVHVSASSWEKVLITPSEEASVRPPMLSIQQ